MENFSISQYKKLSDNITKRNALLKNPILKPLHIKKDFISLHAKCIVLYFLTYVNSSSLKLCVT